MKAIARGPGQEETGAGRTILATRLPLRLVVFLMAFTFVAGLSIGLLAASREQPATGMPGPGGQLPAAPPLTDEQLDEGLPPGHPTVAPAMPGPQDGQDAPSGTGAGSG